MQIKIHSPQIGRRHAYHKMPFGLYNVMHLRCFSKWWHISYKIICAKVLKFILLPLRVQCVTIGSPAKNFPEMSNESIGFTPGEVLLYDDTKNFARIWGKGKRTQSRCRQGNSYLGKNIRKLKTFLGHTGHFPRYVKDHATILSSLMGILHELKNLSKN